MVSWDLLKHDVSQTAISLGSSTDTIKATQPISSIGSYTLCVLYLPSLISRCSGRIEEIAKKRDVSMAQIGVAWVLSKEGVTAPIVGTTNLDNLKDIIGASCSSI